MEAWLLLLAIGLFSFLGSLLRLALGIHVNSVALSCRARQRLP